MFKVVVGSWSQDAVRKAKRVLPFLITFMVVAFSSFMWIDYRASIPATWSVEVPSSAGVVFAGGDWDSMAFSTNEDDGDGGSSLRRPSVLADDPSEGTVLAIDINDEIRQLIEEAGLSREIDKLGVIVLSARWCGMYYSNAVDIIGIGQKEGVAFVAFVSDLQNDDEIQALKDVLDWPTLLFLAERFPATYRLLMANSGAKDGQVAIISARSGDVLKSGRLSSSIKRVEVTHGELFQGV